VIDKSERRDQEQRGYTVVVDHSEPGGDKEVPRIEWMASGRKLLDREMTTLPLPCATASFFFDETDRSSLFSRSLSPVVDLPQLELSLMAFLH
jgi:hypothetical protein